MPKFNDKSLTIRRGRTPFGKLPALAACLGLSAFLCLPSPASAAEPISPQSFRGSVNPGGPEVWAQNPGGAPAQDEGPAITFGEHEKPLTLDEANGAAAAPPMAPAPMPPTAPMAPQGTAPAPPSVAPPLPMPDAKPAAPAAMPPATQAPQSGKQISGATSSENIGAQVKPDAQTKIDLERPVIYVDEQGNEVPKPPEPDKMFDQAEKLMETNKYDEALAVLDNIRQIPTITKDMREKVLYAISDCNWNLYAENPLAGYEPIVSSTNEALNANLRSKRVPDALLRLGMANVNVNNLDDASGYMAALMRRYPDYPGVAQGFTALGKGQLKAGQNARAEQSFGIVLDKYPESSQLQDASVGLARSLLNQGKNDRAQVILDFLGKRWPRYYINDPDFLLNQAANDEKHNRKDAAMDAWWLYVNLDPARPANAPLLLKMGDQYMRDGKAEAADFVYSQIGQNFPADPAAQTAKRRLVEKGIFDAPFTYAQLESSLASGGQPLWNVYKELADSSNTSPEGVMARLKQAMWLYKDGQYSEAMGKASDFIDNYPENVENAEARNLLWMAFQKELAQSLAERNYGRILLLWNGFPLVRERYGNIDAPLRYALAEGWAERGEDDKAFELLSHFLKDPMDPQYGEAAFSKFFNHYLQTGAWDKILDLGNIVRNWKMRPELQNQLDYAMALSAQNLNLTQPALTRWRALAGRADIPLYQRAYATYFIAKDAERRRDIRNAYQGNRKVVELFQQLADERSDKADPERIKEAISSLMDICEVGNRVPEALEWVDKYSQYVKQDSPEYPGLRYREARLYRKLGDNSRARALLEDIVGKFPQSPFSQAASAELRSFEVSRDLQRFASGTPNTQQQQSAGTRAGNWSSTAPAAN